MRWPNSRTLRRVLVLALTAPFAGVAPAQEDEEAEDAGRIPSSPVKVEAVAFPDQAALKVSAGGAWLPVYVELSSATGRTETVAITGSVVAASDRSLHFQSKRTVAVAPGAPQRTWVYLCAGASQGGTMFEAAVEISTASGTTVYRRSLSNIHLSEDAHSASLSLLVLGENLGDLVPWPGPRALPVNARRLEELDVGADSLAPSQAPDSWLGYHAHGLVIIRGVGAQAMEPAQVEALRAWVQLGGHVILAPQGRSPEVFASALAKTLLGSRLRQPVARDGFVPRKLVESELRPVGPATRDLDRGDTLELTPAEEYTLLDPLAVEAPYSIGAVPLDSPPGGTAPARLYAELPYGRGTVGLLCLDDQAHRGRTSQSFLRALWSPIVRSARDGGQPAFTARASTFISSELAGAMKDPQREVGGRVMIGMIAGYVILIGPVLYFVLRRLNRLPAVLWVEPLLVAVSVGAIFATAYLTKGVLTKVRLWTIISQRAGESAALRESYLSLFAGAEGTYGITASRGTAYLRPIFKNEQEWRPPRLSLHAAGELTLEGNALSHWQEGGYTSAGIVDLGGQGLELDVSEGAAEPTVRVTNNLAHAVLEGVVYVQGRGHALPAIASGAAADVDLSRPIDRSPHLAEVSRLSAALRGNASRVLIIALVDRDEQDFTVDQPTSVSKRLDYYVLEQ